MDFAALPPEVNSGLMYTGPGSAPMLAAATAWDNVSAEMYSAAQDYGSVIANLAGGPWRGAASASMAAAAEPYVSWMTATAAQADQTAAQARAAVGAYETAFALTVPPPVIAANRTLLASLVATNILGQNSPAIGALAVPQKWESIAPPTGSLAPLLGDTPVAAPAAVPGMPGLPAAGAAAHHVAAVPKYGFRPTVMVSSPAAG